MSIAVCYLARGVNGGLEKFKSFRESYVKHPAGQGHSLYILAKGWDDQADYRQMQSMASALDANVLDLPDDGLDWGAYMRASTIVLEEYLFFLNTHSKIKTDHWLAKIFRAYKDAGGGIIGCTGSIGSIRIQSSHLLRHAKDIAKISL